MRLCAFVGFILFLSCNGSLPPAPEGPTPPEPAPVVGHWNLESAWSEHLWIEIDGTFSEAGGPQLGAGSLSGILSAGSWTFSAPTLALEDVHTGEHTFDAIVGQDGRLTLIALPHSYHFDRDISDAGTDH